MFDVNTQGDQILNTLEKVRKMSNNHKINVTILQIFEGISKSIGVEPVANKILLSLIPMLVDQSLAKAEFKMYFSTVQTLLKRIEGEMLKTYEGMPEQTYQDDDEEVEEKKPEVIEEKPTGNDFDFLNMFQGNLGGENYNYQEAESKYMTNQQESENSFGTRPQQGNNDGGIQINFDGFMSNTPQTQNKPSPQLPKKVPITNFNTQPTGNNQQQQPNSGNSDFFNNYNTTNNQQQGGGQRPNTNPTNNQQQQGGGQRPNTNPTNNQQQQQGQRPNPNPGFGGNQAQTVNKGAPSTGMTLKPKQPQNNQGINFDNVFAGNQEKADPFNNMTFKTPVVKPTNANTNPNNNWNPGFNTSQNKPTFPTQQPGGQRGKSLLDTNFDDLDVPSIGGSNFNTTPQVSYQPNQGFQSNQQNFNSGSQNPYGTTPTSGNNQLNFAKNPNPFSSPSKKNNTGGGDGWDIDMNFNPEPAKSNNANPFGGGAQKPQNDDFFSSFENPNQKKNPNANPFAR
jgi:hypothetical protein